MGTGAGTFRTLSLDCSSSTAVRVVVCDPSAVGRLVEVVGALVLRTIGYSAPKSRSEEAESTEDTKVMS